ncbi:hypothetical protein B0H17DRAFT_1139678 [Mycena rosella]|uniref:Uncharacterized protein n=1 Tax=Mycena rosella TaxID=1033263 RepID=A0AAD7D3K2_MYCRO|nr:hypothetical protein B0H17DRAFT_1139678 [Mycena rosella]
MIRTIKCQIWAACSGVQESVDNLQTATGVKDKTVLLWIEKARETQKERFSTNLRLKDKKLTGEARRKVKTRIKDLIQWELYNWVILQPGNRYAKLPKKSGNHYNILLSLRGLDPHQDSPCEILHSILLGDDKYIWHEMNTKWDKAKGEIFAIRLQSSSTNGLNMASVRGRYIVKYKNTLIGKHFKVVQQLGIFHLHNDLCSSNLFDLWRASGELGALLWFPEFRNLEQYLADLQICIDNVLDIWALIDPARIVTKFKLHVLSHLPDDIRDLRMLEQNIPTLQYSVEPQAPSHDIGVTLADMERFKHQVSGGWCKPPGLPEIKNSNADWAGWTSPNQSQLESRQKAISASWREIIGPHWSAGIDAHGAGKVWTTCKYVISQAGDDTDIISAGRITNILIPLVSSTQHGDAVDILFHFNAQHDCKNLKCRAVDGAENIVQERGPTGCTQAAVQHVDTNIYFINMHALHNAHLLQETLPRNLTAPVPYFTDRDVKHREFAALLRVSGPAKRATALKKAKETREKKKRAKEGEDWHRSQRSTRILMRRRINVTVFVEERVCEKSECGFQRCYARAYAEHIQPSHRVGVNLGEICGNLASFIPAAAQPPGPSVYRYDPRSNTLVFGARTHEETETPEREAGNMLVFRVSCFGEDPNQRMHWSESEHKAKYDGICGAFAEVQALGLLWIRVGSTANDGCAPKGQGPSPKYGCVGVHGCVRSMLHVCVLHGESRLVVFECGESHLVVFECGESRHVWSWPGVAGCVQGCLSECGFLVHPNSEGRVIHACGCRHGMGEMRGHTQSIYSPHTAACQQFDC